MGIVAMAAAVAQKKNVKPAANDHVIDEGCSSLPGISTHTDTAIGDPDVKKSTQPTVANDPTS